MLNRSIVLMLVAACLLVCWPANLAFAQGTGSPPNIIVVLADDLGWGDLTCYNADSRVSTPNLDRLAKDGIRFTDAHSPSAVCTPTRYGLLTGRYCWRSRLKRGVLGGNSKLLIEQGRATVASMLQEAGYHTACIGKWHLGLQTGPGKVDWQQPMRPGPVTVGFDYFYGIPASLDMAPYVWVENDRLVAQPTERVPASGHRREGGGGFWRGGAIAPGFKHADVQPTLIEKSVQYINQRNGQVPDQPFFLYLPLASPHTPWVPSEPFMGRTGVDAPGGYYTDFVAEIDWGIGQLIHALEAGGELDNTLIIVTSDNGSHWLAADIERHGHHANGPWRGQKADIYEGGHRVPFVLHWPAGAKAGAVCDQPVCHVDLFATFASIAGKPLEADQAEDSFDLTPLLNEPGLQNPIRASMVLHALNGTFAIRVGQWKLIPDNLGSGGFTRPSNQEPETDQPNGQLYNLAEDPGETSNLYTQHPERVEQMRALLEAQQEAGRTRP
ncbi:MAG: arylsulfatase [Planctomycetota bacterium]